MGYVLLGETEEFFLCGATRSRCSRGGGWRGGEYVWEVTTGGIYLGGNWGEVFIWEVIRGGVLLGDDL